MLQPRKLKKSELNPKLSRNLVFNKNTIQKTTKKKHSRGTINNLDVETQSLSLHINSIFRDNYYLTPPTDFTYTIPINCENITSLRLTSLSLPNTWYLFSSEKGNNKFNIEIYELKSEGGERDPNGATWIHTVVIPDGNYTRDQLVTFLNRQYFEDLNEGENVIDVLRAEYQNRMRNIRFEINPNSLKTSFHILETDRRHGFDLIFVDEHNNSMIHSAGWLLGFRKAKYINVTKKIQSEALFDGGGERYIYFSLNDFTLNKVNDNIICLDNTYMEKNILAKINISTNSFGIQIEDNPDSEFIHTKTRLYSGPVSLKKLKIKLIDMYGNLINLNSMDFSFTLELEKLYQNIV